MKMTSAFVILSSFLSVFLMSACAPVASSVPKSEIVNGPNMDSTQHGSVHFDLDIASASVKVVSADQSASYQKGLDSDYVPSEFNGSDAHTLALKNSSVGDMNLFPLAASVKRADVIVILVVNSEPSTDLDAIGSKLKLVDLSRTELNEFGFKVSQDGASGSAWNFVKGNLVSVTIVSREAKAK